MKKEFKPQAYCTISNSAGMLIEVDERLESVRYQYCDGKVSRPCQLKFHSTGRITFRAMNRVWDLSNFMKL